VRSTTAVREDNNF